MKYLQFLPKTVTVELELRLADRIMRIREKNVTVYSKPSGQ